MFMYSIKIGKDVSNFLIHTKDEDVKMKKLIVVRHGAYDVATMNLHDIGRRQMLDISPKIHDAIGNDTAIILSSTAPRAEQSAQVLADQLNTDIELHEVLWSESGRPTKPDTVLELIKSHDEKDVVILLTHLEYTDIFPAYYARRVLNTNPECQLPLSKGEMLILDCDDVVPDESADMTISGDSPNDNRGVVTYESAIEFAQKLLALSDRRCLKKVYLFGSVAVQGVGNDIDLVLEVSEDVFLRYATACIGTLNGYHPIKKALMPMAGMYWDYYSPQMARVQNALTAIGLSASKIKFFMNEINGTVTEKDVDIICLPVGWNDERTDVNLLLQENFGFDTDPNLLNNIISTCVDIEEITNYFKPLEDDEMPF